MSNNNKETWQPVQPSGIPAPAGAYSPGVIVGNLVFTAGQIPRNPITGELAGSDIRSQSLQVLENLDRVLVAAGTNRKNIVSLSVFLSDVSNWSEFDTVYREFMSPPFPARTVTGAQLRGILVEITAIAVIPNDTAVT